MFICHFITNSSRKHIQLANTINIILYRKRSERKALNSHMYTQRLWHFIQSTAANAIATHTTLTQHKHHSKIATGNCLYKPITKIQAESKPNHYIYIYMCANNTAKKKSVGFRVVIDGDVRRQVGKFVNTVVRQATIRFCIKYTKKHSQ